jgi:cytochrome oxidase Cu insertion factor (SCO1/SenC/PrrC family)
MKLSARMKLALIASLFALPMVASFVVYKFFRPEATANYGELLLPPATITPQPFNRPGGGTFSFSDLLGKWVLVVSDSGACPQACTGKLVTMRQVRLALGRNAERLERVLVVDDLNDLDPKAVVAFEGTQLALTRTGLALPLGASNDRAHIYLVDPRGNVMMRWTAQPDWRRMLKDLERLLKASQIG